MPSIAELKAQREALDAQIHAATQTERKDAIDKVRALMDEYGLTVADFGKGSPKSRATKTAKKVAAKYSDKAGNTWSGRGLQPKWLKAALASGKKIGDFAI